MMVNDDIQTIREKKMEDLMQKTSKVEVSTNMPQGKPEKVSDGTFDQFVGSNSLVLVDAWAPWCAPCRMLGPTIDQIASEQAGKVAVGKLNVDENRAVSMKFRIMSIPTMLIFKKGKPISNIVGFRPKEELERNINAALD